MKNKKVRGYISARDIDGSIVSHKIQNLVIRDFCQSNNFSYLLSSVEYKMRKSFLILQDILSEIKSLDGIVMYSMFQVPTEIEYRKKLFKDIIKKKKFISFAVENIIIKNQKDLKKFEEIYKINSLLKFCPTKI